MSISNPLAEAEVLIHYGRTRQAINVLKDALRANPDQPDLKAKLLELEALPPKDSTELTVYLIGVVLLGFFYKYFENQFGGWMWFAIFVYLLALRTIGLRLKKHLSKKTTAAGPPIS